MNQPGLFSFSCRRQLSIIRLDAKSLTGDGMAAEEHWRRSPRELPSVAVQIEFNLKRAILYAFAVKRVDS